MKRKKPATRCTFSSWIRSSILLDAVSWDLKREIVLVSSGSKMFPLSSRTTRSKPRILSSMQVTRTKEATPYLKAKVTERAQTTKETVDCTRQPTHTNSIPSNNHIVGFPVPKYFYSSPFIFPLKGKIISQMT